MRHPYADFIDRVAKPARYLGGEYQAVAKDDPDLARICLAFPDIYDIGMSHLGTKILYSLLNRAPDIACERAFAPWLDMEAELRARGLPLVSLETMRPLSAFDVVGMSIQYELTYTNMLTMLDLGGIPLRASERGDDVPLVLVGGPTASHCEPIAPFIDAAFIGEAEEQLPDLVRAWTAMRRARTPRRDALVELAARFSVYVPALYATEVDAQTGMTVVGAPLDPRVPARVRRAMVADLDAYPFPSDSPVPYAEAVFERASVEIARGCTEGCRFCQAGMIYRPVRERSPASITKTLLDGVDRAGYEETGLTCLSTADFSSITPLVKSIAGALKERGVAMSVASLRAYGLGEELLDELATTRINGLTFAPEAGTQRMRDVVNKNITEAHVEESARRVFSRGWHRVKLYFMIGLPTEEDDDVRGIVETARRVLAIGRGLVGRRTEVTASTSSHVPKPHTPLQWCAQDFEDEILRRQALLRSTAGREPGLRVKMHNSGISFVEGVLARGDRRLADAIELTWRAGARFDGWDEVFDGERWARAFADTNVDTVAYIGTRPVSARLPWDHIDVGLEDGFLLAEYRKALKGRASPPCGKVAGMLVHHTSLADAEPDRRKLVCYDCGVACDLSKMRDDRLVALRALGAFEKPKSEVRSQKPDRETERAERVRLAGHVGAGAPYTTFRLRFAKLGRAAFLGHLDLVRLLARTIRRAGFHLATTRGFSPKPRVVFGPALPLGVPSLGELVDIDLEHDGAPPSADDVRERLASACPPGIAVSACDVVRLVGQGGRDIGLGKLIDAIDLAIAPVPDGIVYDVARLNRVARAFLAKDSAIVARDDRSIDVRAAVGEVDVIAGDAASAICTALEWPVEPGLLRARVRAAGSCKPVELARALGVWSTSEDPRADHARIARLGVVAGGIRVIARDQPQP
jgi:radical SAM family uncharacterized protein/radical SAM-linked protein